MTTYPWEEEFNRLFVHKNYHQEIPDVWKPDVLPDHIKDFIIRNFLRP